jgi:hypothetical protein
VEESEAAANTQRETVKQLLTVVKGWTVVTTTTTARAAEEVKQQINEVPAQTAEAVVQRIVRDPSLSDPGGSGSMSGTNLPRPPLPPPPPPEGLTFNVLHEYGPKAPPQPPPEQ